MKNIIISLLLMLTAHAGVCQKLSEDHRTQMNEALSIFEKGEYQQAGENFSQLLSIYPQNVELNYLFGVCSVNNGSSPDISIRHLEYASSQGNIPESHYYLGKAYHLNYDFDKAIASFKTFVSKMEPKDLVSYDVDHEIRMCNNGKTLMNNIKDLVVMDKKVSGEEDFFRYYELTNMGGKLLSVPQELKSKMDKKKNFNGVLFYNGTSNEVYFASYGDKGRTGKDIYMSRILPNGKYAEPQKVPGIINTPYDEDFPFLHPDGKSLYFSSKGHSSMGGYDVFRATFNTSTGKYDTPINLDFAVNTPDDDILYVTDSLHQEAWFASGRNIATGSYNIYNVKVKGVPMNLIFIKGVFGATYDEDIKDAYIVVRDELTNREVAKVYSDKNSGDYIIPLYKPGQYKFEVRARDSQITHEGFVQVPASDESAVYGQELQLVMNDKLEKLVIINNFDAPLDYDIAELQREIIRKKSDLDINSDEMEVPEEELLINVDQTIGNATLAAGFAEGITIKDVVAGSREDLSQKREQLEEIEKNNSYAYAYALEMQDLAREKMDESKQLRSAADPDDVVSYENTMREADKVLFEANQYAMSAQAAMRVAERSKAIANQNRIDIQDIENNTKSIIEGEMNNDFDRASTALRWEKDRQNAKKGITAITAGDMAQEDYKRIENEETDALKEVESLTGEETLLLAKIKRNEENLAREKKKSKIKILEAEKVQFASELTVIQEDLSKQRSNLKRLGKEEVLLKKEAEFYANQYIVPETMQVSPISLDDPQLASFDDDYDELDDELELDMSTRNIDRFSDNSETLYASNESKSQPVATEEETTDDTFEETSKTPETDESIVENEVSVTDETETVIQNPSSTEVDDDFLVRLDPVEGEDIDPLIRIARVDRDISVLERQITAYEKGAESVYTADEIGGLKLELEQQRAQRSALETTVQTETMTREESIAVYNEFEPNYRASIQDVISESENEIEQSIEVIAYKKEVRSKLKSAIDENLNRMTETEDEDELTEISKDNLKYQQAYDLLNKEIYDVNTYKAAFESENKSIVDSEEMIAQKLDEQIRLTNQFIGGIDQVIETTLTEIDSSESVEEKEMLQDLVVKLNEEREQAEMKLSNYEDDLALTTNADEFDMSEPMANNDTSDAKEESKTEEKELAKPVSGGTFNEIFADVPYIKPEDAFFSETYLNLVDRSQGTRHEVNNIAEIEAVEDEIYELELQHKEASEEDKIDLDKKIEKKFTELSKLELRNYSKLHRFSAEEMKANAIKIDSLRTLKRQMVEKRIVKDELKKLTQAIDFESIELEKQRKDIPDSEDYIEQAFMARQAFGLETSILQKQKKMIALYENLETLNDLSDEEVRDMNAGKYEYDDEEEIEITFDSEINWTLLEEESELPLMETSPYVLDLRSGVSTNATDLIYMDHLRLIESKLSDQSKSIEQRNSLQEDYDLLEEEIEVIEFKIANTKNKKEREVLEEELSNLRAQADVLYTKITSLNETISKNEADIEELLSIDVTEVTANNVQKSAQTNEDSAELKSSDIQTETEEDSDPSLIKASDTAVDIEQITNDNVAEDVDTASNVPVVNDPELSTEVKTNEIAENTKTSEIVNETKRNTSVSTNEPMRVGEEEFPYAELYNFPNVLMSDIFRMHASTNTKRDIPTNVKLPSGTIYKIQVGAFRNPIKSDVFNGFSPVTGEKLNNGITRYTAGLFITYANADDAKRMIRDLGYSDAFVVKFVDGKRVSISGLEMNETIVENTTPDVIADNPRVNTESSNFPVEIDRNDPNFVDQIKKDKSGAAATAYYNSFEGAAKATTVESIEGVFFTVQIGVYSRPVPASELNNIDPLNAEVLNGGKYRYSTGIYTNLDDAVGRKGVVQQSGFSDAFVTAYYNGKRIKVAEAKALLSESSGNSIKVTPNGLATGNDTRGSNSLKSTEAGNTSGEIRNESTTNSSESKSTTTSNSTNNTVSMEMETPVMVKTKVNELSEGEPVRMIQMEYDVLLVSTSLEEIPEMVRKAMEQFGDRWGIKAVRKGTQRLVYTQKVSSLQEARNIQKELESFGVVEPEIRAFRIE